MAVIGHRRIAVAVTALLLCAACSGSGQEPTASAPATDAGQVDSDEGDTNAADGEAVDDGGDGAASRGGCPVEECDDALLAQLAGIPVPDTVEAYAGGQTEADRNDGVTAVQQLFLSGTVADAAAFYDAEVERMGVEVRFRFAEGDDYAIDYVTPDDEEVIKISIGPREFHPVELVVSREPNRDF